MFGPLQAGFLFFHSPSSTFSWPFLLGWLPAWHSHFLTDKCKLIYLPLSLQRFLFRSICRYFDVPVSDPLGYTDNTHSLSLNLRGTSIGLYFLCSGSACVGCLDPGNRSYRGGGAGNALHYCGEELCLGGGEAHRIWGVLPWSQVVVSYPTAQLNWGGRSGSLLTGFIS